MKVFNGKGGQNSMCDRCWTLIEEGELVTTAQHPGREFCSTDCSEKFIPPEYRCPDCVTKHIDPCVHARA